MTNIIVKNISSGSVLIFEINQVIEPSDQFDLLINYGPSAIATFESLKNLLRSGKVVINDGTTDLPMLDSLFQLFGLTTISPSAYDGKAIVQTSPRPLTPKTYTNWTGSGDDIDNSIRGGGPKLLITISGTDVAKSQDVHFLTDSLTYLRQAYIGWENAPWGASVHADFYALPTVMVPDPAGSYYIDSCYRIRATVSGGYSLGSHPWPVPAMDANHIPNGYWNMDANYNVTYAPNGDGAYNFYPVEVRLGTFLNNVPVYGTNYGMMMLDSDDIEMIAPGYFLRVTVNNVVPGTDWKLWSWLVCYREDIS